jgi:hypothetical protein
MMNFNYFISSTPLFDVLVYVLTYPWQDNELMEPACLCLFKLIGDVSVSGGFSSTLEGLFFMGK